MNQNRETGYFIPDGYHGEHDSKPVHQLTCFCLSALHILGGKPAHHLKFVEKLYGKDKLESYLTDRGCFEGVSTAGNMAMFVAIFLTYQYGLNQDDKIKDYIEHWFDLHISKQNKTSGFWGHNLRHKYFAGFQNAFHQFVIFNYWKHPVPNHKKIVDTVLSLADMEGHFGVVPGGSGCYDYDAADILINCGYKKYYRKSEVTNALQKLFTIILNEQNYDGGFCDTVKTATSLMDLFQFDKLQFCFLNKNPLISYFRLYATINAAIKKRKYRCDHWTDKKRFWRNSDLWNTWFRCLTIAQIDSTFNRVNGERQWRFHDFIGLGYFSL
ncbi:hypothetical protein [uncultured Desulfobacter sp.]|uniref:prenyltransferase/squalene oxidase repeat-containing protein n=1 Tax=uncultured Desulfobacter sp. TaxID=240139 RepID=UPI0029F47FA7|nr:hypothetical protein [uncultured Desulfobacter sp.]